MISEDPADSWSNFRLIEVVNTEQDQIRQKAFKSPKKSPISIKPSTALESSTPRKKQSIMSSFQNL